MTPYLATLLTIIPFALACCASAFNVTYLCATAPAAPAPAPPSHAQFESFEARASSSAAVLTAATRSRSRSTSTSRSASAGPAASSSSSSTRTVFFHVHDPDPATNASTSCGATWPASEAAPGNWMLCADPAFEWRFGSDFAFSFTAVAAYGDCGRFGISVRHSFRDRSVGKGFYGYRTSEGWTSFNRTNLRCRNRHHGRQRFCELQHGEVIDVPIYVVA